MLELLIDPTVWSMGVGVVMVAVGGKKSVDVYKARPVEKFSEHGYRIGYDAHYTRMKELEEFGEAWTACDCADCKIKASRDERREQDRVWTERQRLLDEQRVSLEAELAKSLTKMYADERVFRAEIAAANRAAGARARQEYRDVKRARDKLRAEQRVDFMGYPMSEERAREFDRIARIRKPQRAVISFRVPGQPPDLMNFQEATERV